MIPQLAADSLAAWRADATRVPPPVVDMRGPWEVEIRIDAKGFPP